MKNKLNAILSIAGFVALIIVILLIVLSGTNGTSSNSTNYKQNDANKPIATLSTKKIDWGEINLNDTKESEIELKNDGNSPLEITKMSTSCGCTSVKAIYADGKETKEYNMHKTSEKVTVDAKSSIKLKIIYRPYTMPVEGAVTRQIFLETNDPNNKNITIDASAVVKK